MIRTPLRASLALTMVMLARGAVDARGQTLAVSGDHFTVNGTGRFLVFVSYFHGLDRPPATLSADLAWLQSKGVSGLRVWPNAATPKLMNSAGQLDATALQKLKNLVAAAASHGMIVDITFHREGVCPTPDSPPCDFSVTEYSAAIADTARQLNDKSNILFDLQNEWNAQSSLQYSQLSAIRTAALQQFPTLVTTASVSGGSYQDAATTSFEVLSYHGARDSNGLWASNTDDDVVGLRDALASTPRRRAPVYLQEPNRFRYSFDTLSYYDDIAQNYWTAAKNAKASGAAAWTFHTAASFNLANSTAFADLILAGELQVLNQLSTQLATVAWGNTTAAKLTRADYDGDGKTDFPLINMNSAQWNILKSSGGTQSMFWLSAGDLVASADYSGDGKVDVTAFRPGNPAAFLTLRSEGNPDSKYQPWGAPGSVPVPADYDGDGTFDYAVYHTDYRFHVLMSRDSSYVVQQWGATGSIPVAADYDGDGKADFAVYHSDYRYYVLPSSGQAWYAIAWGTPGDVPVPGDYDGDGKADLAVYRPSEGRWYVRPSTGGAMAALAWGMQGDRPVPGDYDGDGRTDPAVYRPAERRWWVLLSSTGFTQGTWRLWGESTDTEGRCAPALNGAGC